MPRCRGFPKLHHSGIEMILNLLKYSPGLIPKLHHSGIEMIYDGCSTFLNGAQNCTIVELKSLKFYSLKDTGITQNCTIVELKCDTGFCIFVENKAQNCTIVELKSHRGGLSTSTATAQNCTIVELKWSTVSGVVFDIAPKIAP